MQLFSFLLDTAQTQPTEGNNLLGTILLVAMVLLLIVPMVLRSRSEKKQQAQIDQMRDSLAVGDEITTIGGIIGKVVSIKGDTFVLETTKQKTRIRFMKWAIRTVDVKAEQIVATVTEAPAEAPCAAEAPADTEEK